MGINWDNFWRVVPPVLGVVVGWVLTRATERRVKLIAYYLHASAIRLPPPQQDPPPEEWHPHVNTHAVVVRNAGKKTATNVRISHFVLPDAFSLWPAVPYELEEVPGSGRDIVIRTLIPGDQITISYLYFPPLLFSGVTSRVRCDEGHAREVKALPTPQPAPWVVLVTHTVFWVGVVALAYLAYSGIKALLA